MDSTTASAPARGEKECAFRTNALKGSNRERMASTTANAPSPERKYYCCFHPAIQILPVCSPRLKTSLSRATDKLMSGSFPLLKERRPPAE